MVRNQLTRGFNLRYNNTFQHDLGYAHGRTAARYRMEVAAGFLKSLRGLNFFSSQPILLKLFTVT